MTNLCKVCVGTGVLALPYSFHSGGALTSVPGLAILAYWNTISVNTLLSCEPLVPKRTTGTNALSRVASAALHPRLGPLMIDSTIVSLMLGVCISYQVAAATFISPSLPDLPSPALATAALVGPISMVSSLAFLARTSLFGLSAIAMSFLLIFYHGLHEYGLSGLGHLSVGSLFPESWASFSHWFGVSSFCFGIAPVTFPMRDSMAQPALFTSAVRKALTLTLLFYVLIGDVTFVLYLPGPPINGDIITSLPPLSPATSFVRLSMTLVCLVSYPLCLVPAAEVIESRVYPSRPTLPQRVAIRAPLVVLTTLVADLVPAVVLIVSLIGCLSVGLVSFIFPPVFHLLLVRRRLSSPPPEDEESLKPVATPDLKPSHAFDVAMLAIGVASTIFTTAMTLASISEQMKFSGGGGQPS